MGFGFSLVFNAHQTHKICRSLIWRGLTGVSECISTTSWLFPEHGICWFSFWAQWSPIFDTWTHSVPIFMVTEYELLPFKTCPMQTASGNYRTTESHHRIITESHHRIITTIHHHSPPFTTHQRHRHTKTARNHTFQSVPLLPRGVMSGAGSRNLRLGGWTAARSAIFTTLCVCDFDNGSPSGELT